jgi:VIT1/CCC1 family predicted Fe2+/Mn2+ transporter
VDDAERVGPGRRARRVPGWSHRHRDVSGGWLRPSVFGAMDGLVTNASLIAGVGGGGSPPHTIVLAGLAGLAAGSFSMAVGEYVSVSSQNELTQAEAALEAEKLTQFPEAEHEELTERFISYGLDPELAARAAEEISRRPDVALRLHVREELGVDPTNLPSPWVAAVSSLLSFAAGAFLPLLPYLFGARTLLISLVVFVVALFGGGAIVGLLTRRPPLRAGLRQLLLGALAAAITFGIGRLTGAAVA